MSHDAPPAASAVDPRAQAVLDEWFGVPGSAEFGTARKRWFKRDDAFDAHLRERFGAWIDEAARGELDHWMATPEGALALVIVLDQLPRNCRRGSPRAFACDGKAVQVARRMVASGADRRLPTAQHRAFVYLPFEHSERVDDQRESLRLQREFVRETGNQEYARHAERHAEIVERFGRFPHRNAVLGRASTDEEIAFLKEPWSSF